MLETRSPTLLFRGSDAQSFPASENIKKKYNYQISNNLLKTRTVPLAAVRAFQTHPSHVLSGVIEIIL